MWPSLKPLHTWEVKHLQGSSLSTVLNDPFRSSQNPQQEEWSLLPSLGPVRCSGSLCRIEQKSFIWVIFQSFPQLAQETKSHFNSFFDSLNSSNEVKHQPHTAHRPLQRATPWSMSHCRSGDRRKTDLFD